MNEAKSVEIIATALTSVIWKQRWDRFLTCRFHALVEDIRRRCLSDIIVVETNSMGRLGKCLSKGVSTAKVGEVIETLTGSHPSGSTVSRVFHTLEDEYE
jgi:hypothetical protein